MTTQTGHGGTIAFATTFFAEILDIQWTGVERATIDTSNFSTAAPGTFLGNRTFIPGDLVDAGALEVEFHFDVDTLPPIADAIATATLSWTDDTTPATWAGSAIMTNFSVSDPLNDKMTATATLKWASKITITASA